MTRRSVEERAERLRVSSHDITRKLNLKTTWKVMRLSNNRHLCDPQEVMRAILRDRASYY